MRCCTTARQSALVQGDEVAPVRQDAPAGQDALALAEHFSDIHDADVTHHIGIGIEPRFVTGPDDHEDASLRHNGGCFAKIGGNPQVSGFPFAHAHAAGVGRVNPVDMTSHCARLSAIPASGALISRRVPSVLALPTKRFRPAVGLWVRQGMTRNFPRYAKLQEAGDYPFGSATRPQELRES